MRQAPQTPDMLTHVSTRRAITLATLWLAGALSASGQPAELYGIKRISISPWDEAAPPQPALRARVKAHQHGIRVWQCVSVQYQCRAKDAPAAHLEFRVLAQTQLNGPIRLQRTLVNEDVHHRGVYTARLFLAPEQADEYGAVRIAAVQVRLFSNGTLCDEAAWPANAPPPTEWPDCTVLENGLVPRLGTPWAHLQTHANGRFKEREAAQ